MKTNFIFIFFIFSTVLVGQQIGFRVGLTTATITGNNDAYKFDFLESFSPGYKLGIFGRYRLSDVIILKPEISYRLYAIKQTVDFNTDLLYKSQLDFNTLSSDLNFDIELNHSMSLIFGMGIDYMLQRKKTIDFNIEPFVVNQDFESLLGDDRFDPFATIGLSYKPKKNFLIDIEYRHLLDNWSTENISNQIIDLGNGSVKIHMINLSIARLF
tara:strand:+ start:21 stop:659 length:639 start_codon:yes stop_codon:yes gene_type:complete